MTRKKTPRGAGYTVRVGGRKYLTASLLKEQVEAAQQQLTELTKQNELLRSKEAKHMEALETVEAVLHTLGTVAEQPAPGTKEHAKWLEAVLLDMQALTLKQELQLNPVAATPQGSQAPSAGPVAASTQAASEATCSRTSSSMDTTGSDASSGADNSSSSSSSGSKSHSSSRHRVTRLLASLTPQEITETKGLSMEELTARFKAGKDRMAQARAASLAAGSGATPDLDAAVTEYGRLCLLSLVSDEARHCRVVGMNLETMQQETMSEQYYTAVVESAQLQPEQVQELCLAYQMFRKVEGELMQQQEQVMKQLQEIMGPGLPRELVASILSPGANSGAVPQAGAAAAAMPPQGQRKLPPSAAAAQGAATAGAVSLAAQLPAQPAAAAGRPAEQLSPQLQHLLKLRAKAEAKAAAAAAKAAATAAGAPDANKQPGDGTAARSSTLPAGSAAGMPRNSSRRGGKGDADNNSGSSQQALHGHPPSRPGSSSRGTPMLSGANTPASSSSSMSAKELLSGGVLTVEVSEKVEALLESLLRVGWGLKHNGRNLATMGLNLMTSVQYADSVIAAWPYFISPQRMCAVVAQANSTCEQAAPKHSGL